ncbi:glycosyltransferase involved in cell wall biosynthesis [Luteibacter sp. HA06]|jgi:glycosyltransferase involved in cell wall biosynthesis
MRIHLLAWDNQRGLSHDIRVVEDALRELGHEVTISRLGKHRNDGGWKLYLMRLRMLLGAPRFDIHLSLEHIRPAGFGLAGRHLLIPNPEWLSTRGQRDLARYDGFLTKTHEATRIFESLGLRTMEIGFRSPDRYDADVPRDPRGFLHAAGASKMKGTTRLIDVWKRHPEWPTLTVLRGSRPGADDEGDTSNVRIVREYLPDAEVRRLQNASAFHLCLSRTEGWGHYLVEAMSCAAVVLATDGAPMNQMIDASRGLPVRANEGDAFHLARTWEFDEKALEEAVERAIAMPATERETLGASARRWYLDNEASFASRLGAALDALR